MDIILGWRVIVVSVVTLAVVAGGCAKRPATTQASAPAPTGAAGTTGAGAGSTGSGAGTGAGQAGRGDASSGAAGSSTTAALQPGAGAGGTSAGTGSGSGAAGAGAGSGAAGAGSGAAATGAGTGSGSSGTPSGGRPAPREFTSIPELEDVFFDFDKYDIRPADAKVLDSNASWLKENANQLLLIEGHCDERGTNEYNLALGERRAKAAMNYLVAQGVQANRITIISYGEERPLCREKNEACWGKNRRAHFLVKPR
jgi:peptidoglycan-associated lipoprotein